MPFIPLGHFPTRVHRLDGATKQCELWVKREDQCADGYGGNKVRKLEFLLGDARARGQERLVTLGGYGSHHVLATGFFGAAAGFSVEAVVFPQPITPHVLETIRAAAAAGVRYRVAGSYAGVAPRLLAARARPRTAFISPGGSSPVGTLGFVSAGLELAAQMRAGECPVFDEVYVALGSCGTAAGLWLGLRLAGLSTRVVAVRVVDRVVCNRRITRKLAASVLRLLSRAGQGAFDKFDPGDLLRTEGLSVDDRHFGAGYGHGTDAAQAAEARAAAAGLSLETTYTAKAFAALLEDADAGALAGKKVLFVDTFSSVDLAPLLAKAPPASSLPAPLARLFAAAEHR